MKVKLIAKTVICDDELKEALKDISPEALIMYCARVSNPNNQTSSNSKILDYCAKNAHWSVFEMSDLVFEVETSRMIAPQILRHWSFSFQEFSQRYAAVDATGIELYAARRQDLKNRQNSIDDLPAEIKEEWLARQAANWSNCFANYKWAIDNGIAKECARAVLPLQTKTRMYMKGNIRDWIHYLSLRTGNGTQQEHQDIANAIKAAFVKEVPVVAEALGWK